MASKNNRLVRLWFEGQKYYPADMDEKISIKEDEILIKTADWLDDYFNGDNPSIDDLDLAPSGTEFRRQVWHILCEIPYGKTVTYNDIAKKIAEDRGIEKMSAQAVGGAVGHNPIAIIIPCHRVVGSDGSLTGYAAGLDRKRFLLNHEKMD